MLDVRGRTVVGTRVHYFIMYGIDTHAVLEPMRHTVKVYTFY